MPSLCSTSSSGSVSISIVQGSSKTLELCVVDEDGNPVDLTGATIYFCVAQCDGADPVIEKSSAVLTEIEILDQVTYTGKARIYLDPADTATLDPGDYLFDVWVELASGKRYPVISRGTLTIINSICQIP